ncbi:MAG: NDP-sugar synthase [Candidatus Ratteibacteria bacterium]|jgi:NDP-sugar pyrophosphorylase family protein
MKALILSGGEGTRLRPFTLSAPKALLPLVNVPFICYQIQLLAHYGIKEVVLALGSNRALFRDVLGNGEAWGVRIHYSVEEKPLGTGGAIKHAAPFFQGEPFFVLNGDVLADADLLKMAAFHKESRAIATIAGTVVEDPSPFGLLEISQYGRLTGFLEKPDANGAGIINAGIYLFEPEIFSMMEEDMPLSVERDVFPRLLREGFPLFSYITRGYWLDIGTCEKFFTATGDILEGRFASSTLYDKGCVKDEKRPDGINLEGRVVWGAGAKAMGAARIKKWAVVGNNAVIGQGAILEESILFEGAEIEEGCVIKRSIIGHSAIVGQHSSISGLFLAGGSSLQPFTKISSRE